MAATLDQIPSPPTYRFRPTKRELVEFYLLPRARGQDPFPGVIIEDEAAGSTLPWDLFERHGLGSEDEAYFIVRVSKAKKPGARQDRHDRGCDGGVGTWKMQSSIEKCLRVRGKRIRVHVSNLNLHMGKEFFMPNAVGHGKENAPGILVLQELWGVDYEIKIHAIHTFQFGGGYRALIPDWYCGKVALDVAEAQHLMEGLDWQGAVKDIQVY